MELLQVIMTALAVSMDTLAVGIGLGVALKKPRFGQAFMIAAYFGFFQFIMPILGWLLAASFHHYIQVIDHWIAFIVLTFIGLKMIYESFHGNEKPFSFSHQRLFVLAIATSLDAFGVGISFIAVSMNIILASLIIGLVDFSISGMGVYIGKSLKNILERKAEIFGGLTLIAIAIKILLEG